MPRASLQDFAKLVRQLLLNDVPLQAIVAGRVLATRVEDTDEASGLVAQGPMVVFEELSGNATASGFVQHQVFELYGYSRRSRNEARQAYDAAFTALDQSSLLNAGINSAGMAREVQRPVAGRNNDIDAHFMRGRWQASLASE